jgi:probable phosphoglycerate mutase
MRTRKLYLLRHGAIQGFDRKTYIGRLDVPLSAEGIHQAEKWHRFFRNRLPEKIFSSDLKRCLHTAKIIAGPFSDRICIEEAFREISLGQCEGVSMEDIRKCFPRQWELRGRSFKSFRPPEGESFSDFSKRVLPAFYHICENTAGDTIIVAHAGVNRVILADLMRIDLNDVLSIPQDYGAGNVIEIAPAEKKSCISMSRPTGEPDSAFGKSVNQNFFIPAPVPRDGFGLGPVRCCCRPSDMHPMPRDHENDRFY